MFLTTPLGHLFIGNSDQTSADKDSDSPDSSVLSLSGRTDRQRTEFFMKIRTKSGQRTESRQTENPDRIRIANRHRTGFSGKSGQKRDTDSAVRRRLIPTPKSRTFVSQSEYWVYLVIIKVLSSTLFLSFFLEGIRASLVGRWLTQWVVYWDWD